MKPSIEKMLNKPYNEAVEEIEQKIANAVNNNKSIKTILNKGILEYIINNSDEKNPVTILNIRKAIDSKYNRNISNAVTNTLQAKLSGFIGWTQVTKERKTNPAYFFRTDIADVFKKTYEKEPDYLPLKEMFLKTLDNYADTLRQEGTRKVPVHYTAQIPAQNI